VWENLVVGKVGLKVGVREVCQHFLFYPIRFCWGRAKLMIPLSLHFRCC